MSDATGRLEIGPHHRSSRLVPPGVVGRLADRGAPHAREGTRVGRILGGKAAVPFVMKWFDRKFDFDQPVWMFPNTVERLRGTPARLEERVRELAEHTRRHGEAWSIQEHVGHLLDLEPLWLGRVDDILGGVETMRPADLENRKTHEANHNHRPILGLLADFRDARELLVSRLAGLSSEDAARSATHPRLQQPMRLMDLAFFVAEHDDHHFAAITRLAVEQD